MYIFKSLYRHRDNSRMPKNARSPLPVEVRRSKTSLLKFPSMKVARSPGLAFLAWGDFHARSCFARSTIREEKWGLLVV